MTDRQSSEARDHEPRPARRYAQAGVDLEARARFAGGLGRLLARTRRPEVLADAGPFSGLFRVPGGYREPVLAASADGIGTKVRLQLAAGRLDLCGPDIVAHSVNDILTCGARPLFFLDYIAGSGLSNEQKEALVAGIADACAQVGCALLGGETADMPDIYAPGEFDLAGFIVGVVERERIIDGRQIRAGDILLGLPSSGLHTNGYSLARRVLGVGVGEPPEETRRRLEARPPELGGESLGEALLRTHRPYLREVEPVLDRVRGIAHITGGGFPENLRRVLPEDLTAVVDTRAWRPLPIFELIQRRGGVAPEEMYEVFNMGIGLVLVVGRDEADDVRRLVPEALVIGEVRPWTGRPVELLGI